MAVGTGRLSSGLNSNFPSRSFWSSLGGFLIQAELCTVVKVFSCCDNRAGQNCLLGQTLALWEPLHP